MRQVLGYSQKKLTLAIVLVISVWHLNAQTPRLKGTDLVINGESFFAASNIASELTRLARQDGVLPQNESFKQIAVSASSISQILGYYKSCDPKPKYLISDGGGIDLMNGNCSDENCSTIKNCKATLLDYLSEMKKGGTKKVLWMIYPDPQGDTWSNLKKNQDIWARVVPPIIRASEEPKGYVIDMRSIWEGHYNEYTTDGIHCTDAGGRGSAEAFWNTIKADNWDFLDTTGTTSVQPELSKNTSNKSLHFINSVMRNGKMTISFSIDKIANISYQLAKLNGGNVLTKKRMVSATGVQTIEIPISTIKPGIYIYSIKSGQMVARSLVLVP